MRPFCPNLQALESRPHISLQAGAGIARDASIAAPPGQPVIDHRELPKRAGRTERQPGTDWTMAWAGLIGQSQGPGTDWTMAGPGTDWTMPARTPSDPGITPP